MGNWIPGDPTFVSQVLKISSAFTPPPLHRQLVELANSQNKSKNDTLIPATFMRITVTV